MQPSPEPNPRDPWTGTTRTGTGVPAAAGMPQGQPGRTGSGVLVALALCTLLMLGVAFFLSGIFGSGTVLWLGVLAMVPLGLCLVGLRWVDRWDPEPRPVLSLALLWGAGA